MTAPVPPGPGVYEFRVNGEVIGTVYVHPEYPTRPAFRGGYMYVGPPDIPLPADFIEGHDIDARGWGNFDVRDVPKGIAGIIGMTAPVPDWMWP